MNTILILDINIVLKKYYYISCKIIIFEKIL